MKIFAELSGRIIVLVQISCSVWMKEEAECRAQVAGLVCSAFLQQWCESADTIVFSEKSWLLRRVYARTPQESFLQITKKAPFTALEAGVSSSLAVAEEHCPTN